MMKTLFEDNGAHFSDCRKYRYVLWRVWDKSLPMVMFIGLNPSTANETGNDPTIRRVISMGKNWGYGGVYMLNLFSFISTDPTLLKKNEYTRFYYENREYIKEYSAKADAVIFAWGNFKEATELGKEMKLMFPEAYALQINKNGSPKHPLYVKGDIEPIKFSPYH